MNFAITLIVSQISQENTHDNFTIAFAGFVGKTCIKAIHFVGMKMTKTMAHSREAHFVCANAMVYNWYFHEKNIACGKWFIDFNIHRRSF